jgi:hypothetical protein
VWRLVSKSKSAIWRHKLSNFTKCSSKSPEHPPSHSTLPLKLIKEIDIKNMHF